MTVDFTKNVATNATTGISAALWNNISDAVETVAGSINRSATFVVAASNSSTADIAAADGVCDGTADQVEINTAITAAAALGGGLVQLCAGTYTISGSILTLTNVTIQGTGIGTQIILANGVNTTLDIITSAAAVVNVRLRDFYVSGNKANQASGVNNGLNLYAASARCIIERVRVDNAKGAGILLNSGVNEVHVDKCRVVGCDGAGIDLESAGVSNWITDNYCSGNNYGIKASGVDQCHIIGNQCPSNTTAGIWTLNSCSNLNIHGNTCSLNNTYGIYCWNSASLSVNLNQCNNNGQHGMVFNAVTDSEILGNKCTGNSTSADNASPNIMFLTNSNYNNIQFNTCREGVNANKPSFMLAIYDSTCTGNLCTNNDLHPGSHGNLQNNGTSTVTTAGNRTT